MIARRRMLFAWALYDWANTAYFTVIQTFVFAAYFTRAVASDPTTGAAHWGYALGGAGLAVAVGGPLLGAAVDQGAPRKLWLAMLTMLGVAATASLWLVHPRGTDALLALLLVALASASSGLATVVYDAMLPALAPPDRVGRWSGFGWGLGYAGGLACLMVSLFAFLRDKPWFPLGDGGGLSVRATCVLTAGWYAIFALPLLFTAPSRPGPAVAFSVALRRGTRELARTVRSARRYSGLGMFLLAHMLYVDGLATVFAFGGVFAAGTFDMNEAEVVEFGIGISLAAGVGAWLFSGVDDRIGGKRTAMLAVAGLLVTGTVAIAAPTRSIFWGAALGIGTFVGPAQAASRSYLARTAPAELRHQLFGLYALSGRATAFLGPLLVGQVTQLAGSQRIGLATILVLFAGGLVLLAHVPPDAPELQVNRSA